MFSVIKAFNSLLDIFCKTCCWKTSKKMRPGSPFHFVGNSPSVPTNERCWSELGEGNLRYSDLMISSYSCRDIILGLPLLLGLAELFGDFCFGVSE